MQLNSLTDSTSGQGGIKDKRRTLYLMLKNSFFKRGSLLEFFHLQPKERLLMDLLDLNLV